MTDIRDILDALGAAAVFGLSIAVMLTIAVISG